MDTRTLSATVIHHHEGRIWRIVGPAPTMPSTDSDPDSTTDCPTAEQRALLAAWCAALADDIPGIPDDADWSRGLPTITGDTTWTHGTGDAPDYRDWIDGPDARAIFEAEPPEVDWDHIWTMAEQGDASGFDAGVTEEITDYLGVQTTNGED